MSEYKKLMGYNDIPKKNKLKKNTNSITKTLKEQFGDITEGPSYEYAKVLKDMEKSENIQAKAVNNFVKVLKKKGFPKEATNVASTYMVNMRKFHDYIKELTDKLL